jgi:hypothetical protein
MPWTGRQFDHGTLIRRRFIGADQAADICGNLQMSSLADDGAKSISPKCPVQPVLLK